MIGLVTAVYDGYDTLKPFPEQTVEIDAVCVTDDPELHVEGWRMVVQPRVELHPNRAAKFPKMRPFCYGSNTASVWIDASFYITSPTFIADVVPLADPIAAFVHPWRDCIYEEADVSLQMTKYADEPIRAQVARYEARGHPHHWGLWANGVLVRQHVQSIADLGFDWLMECLDYSFQDQLSLAPLLREYGLAVAPLPGSFQANQWVQYAGSHRH